ncbi:MAG: 3-deoxy-manno-octulosonate cytidylyltransferase [Gemmatimonadetes bacterium]|nr:3-deoxy-manno-octulosonate cytidylyltransferase [Gemmatimonadota bacterium]
MSIQGAGVTVVIPARMASSRFPGKPLVSILGLPMIEHVRRRSLLAPNVAHVVVATCDDVIEAAVRAAGGVAVMTRDTHERCTDRVQEAMLGLPGDVVVMVQGDEPLLDPNAISLVSAPLLADPGVRVTNLLSPLESPDDLANPDIVKAVCNLAGDVMFFTRSQVPFFRKKRDVPVYRQTGIMAFRTDFLHAFSALPPTPLEDAESVDMLRALEHGVPIRGVVAPGSTIGVDRPEDVATAEASLLRDAFQKALHDRITVQDVTA